MRARDPHKEIIIRRKAMEMAVREGFDGLSMQKIARAAMLSPGTLYIYFEDREDLILQVYKEEMRKTFAATMENFNPSMHFDEGLRLQWINRARYCMKNPLSMQFMEQFRHTPLHEKALEMTGGTPFKEIMRTFLANAIRNGELVKIPVEVYWAVAFAPMYQLVKFHLQGKSLPGMGKFVLSEDLLMQTLDLVLKSLKPIVAQSDTAPVADTRRTAVGAPQKTKRKLK